MSRVTYLSLIQKPRRSHLVEWWLKSLLRIHQSSSLRKRREIVLRETHPGMRNVSADKLKDVHNVRGPTYMVDIEVNGVKTRSFLDHGVQVTLVQKELLPVIGEKHGWPLEERHKRNLKMEPQPVGATGINLGSSVT